MTPNASDFEGRILLAEYVDSHCRICGKTQDVFIAENNHHAGNICLPCEDWALGIIAGLHVAGR